MKKRLAHDIRYNDGADAVHILHDLADLYLEVKQFEKGLSLLIAVLHYAPADIWTYNKIAIAFDGYGLGGLGAQVARRGLELLSTSM